MKDRKREKPAATPRPPARPWRSAAFSFSKDEANTPDREREQEVTKGLEAIYLPNGKKGDLGTFSRTERSRALRIFGGVVAFCAAASALAWAGLLFFGPPAPAEASGLILAIDGPATIGLGREEAFTVRWSNPSLQSEQEAELRVSVPAEMLFSSIVPLPDDAVNRVWKLGMLAPGAKGEIKVKGVFLGELGTNSAIQAVATSRGKDGGRPREALVVKPILYGESVLVGRFRMPTKVVAGDALAIEYAVANHGAQGLRGLKVRFKVPEGFVPTATGTGFVLLPDRSEWEAPLGDLVAATTNTVRLTGTFAAQSSGDVKVSARVGVSKSDGSFLPLVVGEGRLTVLAGDLGLRIVGNGSDQDRTITPGDPLRLTIQYKNLSPEPLYGVKLVLGFESISNGKSATGTSWLDWRGVVDEGHGSTSTKTRIQTIRYDEDAIQAFAKLMPQEEGTFDITVPTKSVVSGTKDIVIRLTLEGSMDKAGEERSTRIVRTAPLSFRYRTDAELFAEARFFTEEGAPIGKGPLPPVAGKTTGYRIFWRVNKQLHPLENMEVAAILPASVSWGASSSVEAGILSYDEKTRTVRWTLNRMPEEVRELEASFNILLTPTEFDAGRFAELLGESKLTATDATVSESVIRTRSPITTDLQNDDGAKNKGVVKKGG